MDSRRIDDIAYARSWAQEVPLTLPTRTETEYSREVLYWHASMLYDNPLFSSLTKRDKHGFVRGYLRKFGKLIADHGFVGAITRLSEIHDVILDSFHWADNVGTYTHDESIADSPIYLAILNIPLRHEQSRSELVKWVLSFHSFQAKTPYERPDLEGPAIQAWVDRQVELDSIDVVGQNYEELLALRYIVGWLVDPLPSHELVGKHGPGSTAGGFKTVADKNKAYRPSIQSLELTSVHPIEACVEVGDIEDNELIMVNKNIKSLRPITPEPPSTQYGQQALKIELYEAVDDKFRRNPISRHVIFRDQSPSQKAALIGSDNLLPLDERPATIDEKAASDRLSVDLVLNIFSGNLLHLLMCGRSWNTLVKREKGRTERVELRMYGGMGSALTFPVQTIFFTAAAILATIIELGKRELGVYQDYQTLLQDYLGPDGLRVRKRVADSIRIYGDDITVPNFAVDRLVELLTSLGLVTNTEKSFFGDSSVREACGVYALEGRDITPLRCRVPAWKNAGLIDYAAYEGMRSLINRSFLYGYKTLYRAVLRSLRSLPIFINGDEKHLWCRAGKDYPTQFLDVGEILFEEYRGADCTYIGFLSTTASEFSHHSELWEKVGVSTAFRPGSESDSDSEDFYYLTQDYNLMRHLDLHMESHGDIPRGIRLQKHNAYKRDVLIYKHSDSRDCPVPMTFKAWTWAPR